MEDKKVEEVKSEVKEEVKQEEKDIIRIVITLTTEGRQIWKIENDVNNLINYGASRDLAQWGLNQISDLLTLKLAESKINELAKTKIITPGFRGRGIMDIIRGKK